jgi:hypothetical protein
MLETRFVFLASLDFGELSRTACSAVNSAFASFMDGILTESAGGVGDWMDFLKWRRGMELGGFAEKVESWNGLVERGNEFAWACPEWRARRSDTRR